MTTEFYDELRPVGFAVAYRMLGRVSEAEDIVQEAFLRLHNMIGRGEQIESPRAYMSTVVTRLCIDHLRSAHTRRETTSEALPEPLVGESGATRLAPVSERAGLADAEGDPAGHAEVADSLSLAFLVLLESLSPEQRAAFLLREVFDYPYDQIAEIVATSEDNARQLVTRARRRIEERRPRFEPSHETRERLAQRFFAAARDGDLGALEELLAHDVTFHGGGRAEPLQGRVRVARVLKVGLRVVRDRLGGFSLREVPVNGQPGAMVLDPSDQLIGVIALDISEGGRIQSITSVADPDRLQHLGPLADLDKLTGH